ncbi:hypothetical protein, partial [Plasmodium yoelii yoelii]
MFYLKNYPLSKKFCKNNNFFSIIYKCKYICNSIHNEMFYKF